MRLRKYLAVNVTILLMISVIGVGVGSVEISEENEISRDSSLEKEEETEVETEVTDSNPRREEITSALPKELSNERIPSMMEESYDENSIPRIDRFELNDGINLEGENDNLLSSSPDSLDTQSSVLMENNLTDDPIRIDSDDDFDIQAEDENWTGNGSEVNPYIIDDYEIDGGGEGHAIYIGNVSLHFMVKNCTLYNSSANNQEFFENTGLYLYNTTNARLENNTLIDNQNGITTRSSENTVIIDNEIYVDEEESDTESFSQGYDEDFHEKDYSPDSVLVKLETDSEIETKSIDDSKSVLENKADDLAEMIGGQTSSVFPSIEGAEIQVGDEGNVGNIVEFLSHTSVVKYAEPNYQYDLMKEPNDPGYDSLWGMEKIDAPGAWNVTTGSEDVVVAVLDTGIDYNHPDLMENMWTSEEGHHGYNAVNDSYDPMDDYGHGTHVAGTIGAVGNNSLGVVGVNWNVSLMGVRIGGAEGITTANVLAGMEYVLEKRREGENIVATSNSWGGGGKSQLMKEAIAEHRDEDILFVAAAGNDAKNNDEIPTYPSGYDLTNIISVAATNQTDELAEFSNYGARSVHVAAPGVDINSTILDGEYGYASGTSMATPHVSGLAALLAAENISYDHNQLKNALLSSTDEIEMLEGKIQTDGRINASKTLHVEPDPDDVQFRVHRPLEFLEKGRNTSIMVSLDDGVNPVTEANVTAEISTRRDEFELIDDGSGEDQVADDGYYTSGWTPRVSGEITLNITAQLDEEEFNEEILVNVTGDSGITLFESAEESLENNTVSNYDLGVSLLSTFGNTIEDNNVSSNEIGYDLYRSDDNVIANNTAWANALGILFEEADENVLIDNNISMNDDGVELLRSENNTLIGNEIYGNMGGIMIQGLGRNIVEENSLNQNEMGIMIAETTNNTLVNNDINGTSQSIGIILMIANENKIGNNSLENQEFGIWFFLSDDNLIEGNELMDNEIGLMFGYPSLFFFMTPSHENDVVDNLIINNGIGLLSFASYNNTIVENEIKENVDVGVGLIDSEGAELKGNLIGNNGFGMIGELIDETMITGNQLSGNIEGDIMVMQSKGNHIEDNTMTRGLVVIGQELEHWNTHDIDTTNTVNGNPIYYMKNVEGETVPSDAGQVILANCKDVTIEDLDVNEVIAGILIGFSDDNFIINNDLSQNQIGLFLWESHNNELTENTISNNEVGILLGGFSEGNTLADNNISSNEGGILIEFSNENMLVNNTVENNEVGIAFLLSNQNTVKDNIIADNNQVGISLRHSIDNLLYRNQIIENENQAYDDGNNDWNKEYVIEDEVIGGNYWHDHTEPDEYSGPNQDEPGSDGIVDDPREISGGENVDDYPWTNPQFASPPIEISDPQPKDGAEELGVNTTLSVHVEAGIYPTEVEFYLDDTVVYTETIDSAEMVETDPLDLEGGNTYEWYVETTNDDTANRSVSPTYSFTTEVDEVPGFTSLLLLTASIIAVAIYQKKSTKR